MTHTTEVCLQQGNNDLIHCLVQKLNLTKNSAHVYQFLCNSLSIRIFRAFSVYALKQSQLIWCLFTLPWSQVQNHYSQMVCVHYQHRFNLLAHVLITKSFIQFVLAQQCHMTSVSLRVSISSQSYNLFISQKSRLGSSDWVNHAQVSNGRLKQQSPLVPNTLGPQ